MFISRSPNDFERKFFVVNTSKVIGTKTAETCVNPKNIEEMKGHGWVVVGDGKPGAFGNIKMTKQEPEFEVHTFFNERSAEKFMKNEKKKSGV